MSGSGVPTAPKAIQFSSQAFTDRPSCLPARSSRPKPCTAVAAAAAAQQQQATLGGSSQPGEDRVLSAFDKTPSCIILPTGKEFKLQIRYRNGRHPLLGFDAAGKDKLNWQGPSAGSPGLQMHLQYTMCWFLPHVSLLDTYLLACQENASSCATLHQKTA
jgi:hypothetical protein